MASVKQSAVSLIALVLAAGLLLIGCNGSLAESLPGQTFPVQVTAAASPLLQADADLPNFHGVDPGVFRGGRPTDAGLTRLARQGIKTILDLENKDTVVQHEQARVASLGLAFIAVPMDTSVAPTVEQTNSVLRSLGDPTQRPIFVHCHHGSDRTGTMVAVYRIAYDGYTADRAHQEMLAYGFNEELTWLKDFVYRFARDHGGASHPPLSASSR